jgi:transposase InsO family protein
LIDGFSRKLLRLKVFKGTPATAHMVRLARSAVRSFGKPRFLICDHGSQFMDTFKTKLRHGGITVVKGKVRQPSFNGKVERLFRTLRIWLRVAVFPTSVRPLQRRLDRYLAWYNEHRPHAALGGRTPDEAWKRIELQTPIPIRAADPDEIVLQVRRRSYRDDPALPIVTIRVDRKEAA